VASTADTALDSALITAAPEPRTDFSRTIRTIGYVAVVLALASVAASYLILTRRTTIDPTPQVTTWALVVNGALFALLVAVIGWEVANLFLARRRRKGAARLHIRIAGLFALVATVPVIFVSLGDNLAFDRGANSWLADRTLEIVATTDGFTEGYFQDNGDRLVAAVSSIRTELEIASSLFADDPMRFRTYFQDVVRSQPVSAAFLIADDGTTVAEARVEPEGEYPPIPADLLSDARAQPGVPVAIAPGNGAVMGILIRLTAYDSLYLYVAHTIPPYALTLMRKGQEGADSYLQANTQELPLRIAFGLLQLEALLIALLSAIWLGLAFANRLLRPIGRLIDAADMVAGGNLAVTVPVKRSDGDVGSLGLSFNKMTAQLRSQREALVAASGQIDSRRRFIEAVLSGVTAGVVGIDREGNVTVVNRTALRLLALSPDIAIGAPIIDLVPELTPVMDATVSDGRPEHRDQITLIRAGRDRTINVRVTTESTTAENHGYVITLDDITDLVAAQRNSAWADVARRIAHEIKNPLTPIQLSAERLKRKFGKAITEDRSVFDQCTDTIIRQVGDIGRMVDEFSSFARMPKPAFEERDLKEPIRDAVFLMQNGYPDISISAELPGEPLIGRFDTRLISQAMTNLIKNASEAIAAVPPEALGKGTILVRAESTDGAIVVEVIDNGVGLPAENRQRLLEPYMTTREKGTGLGLAIVRKIVEEHGGRIDLLDAPAVAEGGRGAMMRLILPKVSAAPETAAPKNAGSPAPHPEPADS